MAVTTFILVKHSGEDFPFINVVATLSYSLSAYGFTIFWALAACANGMRITPEDSSSSDALKAGGKVQKILLGYYDIPTFEP